MDNDYGINHDFGYGKEREKKELNRLELKNFEEVESYVLEALEDTIECCKGKKVFLSDKIEQVKIELIKS